MKVLQFRPYKKYGDEILLDKIDEVFEQLKKKNFKDQQGIVLCDELIREAKHRHLQCSKERLYGKILLSIDDAPTSKKGK